MTARKVVIAPASSAHPPAITAETLRAPIVCPSLDAIFAPGGPVAALLGPRYRPRAGQVEMVNLIRAALQQTTHAIIEAGTGIGKSFAYLIPVLWSGTNAIVSTSNKALMSQLWESDLPQLRRIAPRRFEAALLKGRSNYLCALRYEAFTRQRALADVGERAKQIEQVQDALRRVPTGDCEEMRLPPHLTAQLTVPSRECERKQCRKFAECWYEAAKRRAAGADIVVTNHALLCYSLLQAENNVLPVRPVLIIDEAHQLVPYAINALTQLLEHDVFWTVVRSKETVAAVEDADVLREARECYDHFFEAVARQGPAARVRKKTSLPNDDAWLNKWALRGEIQEGLAFWDVLKRISHALEQDTAGLKDDGKLEMLVRQSQELAETTRILSYPEPENRIRYCEVNTPGPPPHPPDAYHAQCRPLEVTEVLRTHLFERWPRVICTSATLSVNNNLRWYQRQIGALHCDPPARAAVIGSPFDYHRQMLLYTPRGILPEYNPPEKEAAYVDNLQQEVARLLDVSQGRALVLCTSRRRMRQLYEALLPQFGERFPCYCQGEMAQPELVERFKQAGNAVLFATRSFWEGIDIPGDALGLVILDKIPFVMYKDPVVQRHEQLIRKRGGNPFEELQVGQAILTLRQGAGRLIRSETDRGVIALLDSRVLVKRYGSQIIRSLPQGCQTEDFGAVVTFFRTMPVSPDGGFGQIGLPGGFDPAPVEQLHSLVKHYGRPLLEDPRRCRALLNDLCGGYHREINLLVLAQQERVPLKLAAISANVPPALIMSRLEQSLIAQHALQEDAACWAVAAWAAALDSLATAE